VSISAKHAMPMAAAAACRRPLAVTCTRGHVTGRWRTGAATGAATGAGLTGVGWGSGVGGSGTGAAQHGVGASGAASASVERSSVISAGGGEGSLAVGEAGAA